MHHSPNERSLAAAYRDAFAKYRMQLPMEKQMAFDEVIDQLPDTPRDINTDTDLDPVAVAVIEIAIDQQTQLFKQEHRIAALESEVFGEHRPASISG